MVSSCGFAFLVILLVDRSFLVNVNELNKFHNSKNLDETMQDSKLLDIDFFNLGTSITSTVSHDSTTNEPVSINRQAAELK